MEILFFILGIIVIGLGIYAIIHSRRMKKLGKIQAAVSNCVPSTIQILGHELPCYEITFEIPTAYGVTYNTIKDNKFYNIGEYVEIYYDANKDRVELAKNVSSSDGKGPLFVIAFGVFVSLTVVLAFLSMHGGTAAEISILILRYELVVIFLAVGSYAGFIKPLKLKKSIQNTNLLSGYIVDFKTRKEKNSSTVYTPIYGFNYNGIEMRFEGNVSGNGKKYCQIGRKVTIVFNPIKQEYYCLEDAQETKKYGIIIFFVGLIFLFLMLMLD